MLSSQEPSLFAASLAAQLARLMTLAEFQTHVWSKLRVEERWRLYALRQQALVGDAPHIASSPSSSSSSSTPKSDAAKTGAPRRPVESAVAWFDFNGRMREQAWDALRGTMTPLVATETFCAELLAVLDAHPCAALLPRVEAAVRQAAALATGTADDDASAARQQGKLGDMVAAVPDLHTPVDSTSAYQRPDQSADPSTGTAPAASAKKTETSPESMVFVVRALHGDPAAVMLLWLCRTYAIPHVFAWEPLTSLLPATSSSGTTSVSEVEQRGMPVVFAEASDDFPFQASLCARRETTGSVNDALATARVVVSDPASAAALVLDFFLSNMSCWRGVPVSSSQTTSTEANVFAVEARAMWVEEMRTVTQHLRGPIVALQLDARARARCPPPSLTTTTAEEASAAELVRAQVARVAGRAVLLRDTATHLQRFEELFVQRRLRESLGRRPGAQNKPSAATTGASASTASPAPARRAWFLSLTESGAATTLVDDYFRPHSAGTRVVNLVDLYTAACAYVLCTQPLCQDVLPLRAPSAYQALPSVPARADTSTAAMTVNGVRLPRSQKVRLFTPTSTWAAQGAFRSFPRVPSQEVVPAMAPARRYSPAARPTPSPVLPTTLRLPGVAAHAVAFTNALLQGEAGPAAPDPRRGTSEAEKQATLDAVQRVRACVYPATATAASASLALLTMDAQVSQAAGQLVRARLCYGSGDLPVDELDSAQTAFPVLVSILTGAWALSQSQVTGFPYLWLNPKYGQFLADLVVTAAAQAQEATAARRMAEGFSVRKAPESPSTRSDTTVVAAAELVGAAASGGGYGLALGSWQSKLRDWWARSGASSESRRAGAEEDAKTTPPPAATLDEQTQVLKQDGSQTAAAAKL